MKLTSAAFERDQKIPKKYTCQGQNINPPLQIEEIPYQTRSLALIVDDPDAPTGDFAHWILYNIPVIDLIPENSSPGTTGINGFGMKIYSGPCPPYGIHRYFFRLFALKEKLTLPDGVNKQMLLNAINPFILDWAELVGIYERQ